MNCVALVRHFSSLGQAPGLFVFLGIRCTVVLRCAVAVDDCRDERTVNASVPPMPGDGNPKHGINHSTLRGGAMTTMQACGTGFGTGLVVAVTAAIIWRSPLMSLTLRWLFDSTGTREAARARR